MTTAAVRQSPSVETRATWWLALGIVALPWLQTLEWDFDRSGPLALLTVPLIAGHAALSRACARVAAANRWWRACLGIAIAAVVISTARSSHAAASLTQLAALFLVALAALLAGQLVAEDRTRAELLLGALAVSGAIATVMHWTKWRLGASPQIAFYPHHRLMGLHLLGAAFAATGLLATARRFSAAWFIVGGIVWGGLLWTGSRSPLVGIAAGIAVWFVRAAPQVRRQIIYALVVHVLAGLALSMLLRADTPALGVINTLGRTVGAETAQQLTSNRSVFWAGAWTQFTQSPWSGYGADAYRFLEPKLEGNQPHNVGLQLLLDFGVFGALAAAALLALCLRRAWHQLAPARSALERGDLSPLLLPTDARGPTLTGTAGERDDGRSGDRSPHSKSSAASATASHAVAAWSGLAVACFVAGQLDGYFYYAGGLLTTALAFGVTALANASASKSLSAPARFAARAWPAAAAAALGIVVLHMWLFFHVALAPPPLSPDEGVARAWRAFPSTTLGIDRWIDAWEKHQPDAALELARIAARQSPNGDYYRVKVAGLLLRRGDRAGAQAELAYAATIAPPQLRPVIQQLQQQLAAEAPKR